MIFLWLTWCRIDIKKIINILWIFRENKYKCERIPRSNREVAESSQALYGKKKVGIFKGLKYDHAFEERSFLTFSCLLCKHIVHILYMYVSYVSRLVWERAAYHKQLFKCLYICCLLPIRFNTAIQQQYKIVKHVFCGGCDKVACATTRSWLLTAKRNETKKCWNTLKDNNWVKCCH